MNQTAANVAKKAKKPEHDQDDNYSPEHEVILLVELNFRLPFIQRFIYSPSFFSVLNHRVQIFAVEEGVKGVTEPRRTAGVFQHRGRVGASGRSTRLH
jgi:hypothetical protein